MKLSKKLTRLRRAKRTRAKIRELEIPRICIYRTPQHIYAQAFSAQGDVVIASASSLESKIAEECKSVKGKIAIAKKVGEVIAERLKEKGIAKVAFDRSGFKYHGRVQAVAEGARDGGLDF